MSRFRKRKVTKMAKKSSYSGLQIALHWATVVLIGANWLVSEGMEEALDARLEGEGIAGGFVPGFHVWVGTAVLALVALRLIARLVAGAPGAAGEGLAARLASAVHWGLYALMAAVPALGMTAWYLGIDEAADLHVLVMNGMMILALAHAAVALVHQVILRDGLMARMLPGR